MYKILEYLSNNSDIPNEEIYIEFHLYIEVRRR